MKDINNLKNKFCIFLTASIDTNGCPSTKRNDPKVRESDYLNSLRLWLENTQFKMVFCENSGYDLKNIRNLCDKYPGRVEIIQFYGNSYPRHLGKSYGEFLIIEKAMTDSVFIRQSEYIVKVTGRFFIENIYKILSKVKNDIVYSSIEKIPSGYIAFHTILFIFKKDFFFDFMFKYKNLINEAEGVCLENIFEKSIIDLNKKGYSNSVIKGIKYFGYSGTYNAQYTDVLRDQKNPKSNKLIWRIYRKIGRVGLFLKHNLPYIYRLLKPYFPDKKIS